MSKTRDQFEAELVQMRRDFYPSTFTLSEDGKTVECELITDLRHFHQALARLPAISKVEAARMVSGIRRELRKAEAHHRDAAETERRRKASEAANRAARRRSRRLRGRGLTR